MTARRLLSARVARHCAVLAALLLAAASPAQEGAGDAPYVPTPQVVVDAMLRMGEVGPADYLIDLGSGDGRIVITAAKTLGARGLGVDLDDSLLAIAWETARREGVADRAMFRNEDLFTTDLSPATVITSYLLPEMNLKLRPKLLELRPGTRIVAHDYHFGDWLPDERETLSVPEKKVGNPGLSYVYLWIVPAKVGGRWSTSIEVAGRTVPIELDLDQRFQFFGGTATIARAPTRLIATHIRGDAVSFAFDIRLGNTLTRYAFRGAVRGDVMEGTSQVRDASGWRERPWTARRKGD